MLKILILLSLSLRNLLVSGNPLSVIPLQQCKQNCNCNQNSYQTYQNPTNIPYIQQNPIQNVPTTVYQQPINNQHYPQTYTVQNQFTPFQNQVVDPVNQLNQIYLNKILSNPTVQTFLDPSNLYSQRGLDITRPVNNNPNNIPNNVGNTPIINNYYILPAELFENDVKGIKLSNPPMRDKDANRRPNCNMNGNPIKPGSKEMTHPEYCGRPPQLPNAETCPRREQHRRPRVNERDNGIRRQDRERNGQGRERDRAMAEERHKGRKQLSDRHFDRGHRIPKPKQEKSAHDLVINIKAEPISSEIIAMKPNSDKPTDVGELSPRKKLRKSQDDAIIEDFHEKFPGIPEEVVRKLLSYLRRQLRKQQLEKPPLSYPGINFPLRYDQLFPQFQAPGFQDNQKRPNRRNPNRKPKPKSPSTTKPNTTVETTTNAPTTTEKVKIKKPSTKVQEEEKSPKIVKEQKVVTTTLIPTTDFVIQETTTDIAAKIEDEHIPDISNLIYPDYYPDFTKDKQYLESDEVFNVRNLRDDRYHYTTDRNYDSAPTMHEFNMDKLKTLNRKLEDSFEDVIIRPDIKKHSRHNSDKIQYRTPPLLESPDFRTKQIVKQKSDPNVSYKSSTYSDAKNVHKDGKSYKGRRTKTDNIETLYAHSKVAKYGKTDEDSEENVTPVVTYYLPDNMAYQEDGKTVIIAKSIPLDHFW